MEEVENALEDKTNPSFSWILLTAILTAIISGYTAYYVTISSRGYSKEHELNKAFNTPEPLHIIRPVLTDKEMFDINTRVTNSETKIWTPFNDDETIKFRHFSQVSEHGNFNLPNFFYEGVLIGISDGNYHDIDYSSRRDLSYTNLHKDLETMYPEPSYIFPRISQYNHTKWIDYGYAVYFSYDDLKKQNKISRLPGKPWEIVIESMLSIARNYRQVYMTIWYPNKFGLDSSDIINKHLHTVIVQEIIPTRTGLNGLKSSVVIWLSAINDIEPMKEETVIRKSDNNLINMLKDIQNITK